LRYQVALPLPASLDALCTLKMSGRLTDIDAVVIVSFFFFLPNSMFLSLFFFFPPQQHVPDNSLLPFTVKCNPGSINYSADAVMDL